MKSDALKHVVKAKRGKGLTSQLQVLQFFLPSLDEAATADRSQPAAPEGQER